MQTMCSRRSIAFWKKAGVLGIACLALGLLVEASHAAGKPGQVTTSDDQTFEGDIDESATPGRVDVVIKGIRTSIDKRNVKKVVYFETPKQEFDVRMAKLPADDIPGRLTLGSWALSKNELELAKQAVASAKAIDPRNREVAEFEKKVAAIGKPPATGPATGPAVAGAPAAAGGQPAAAQVATAKRLVTSEEFNMIRQAEWRADDKSVKVRVDPAARKAFIASGVLSQQDAAALSPVQVAWEILTSGTPEQKAGVVVATDPQSMLEFKRTVNQAVVNTCATAGCHSSEKPGETKFVLFPSKTDELSAYTNFVILQQLRRTQLGVEYDMINRSSPEFSLLAQYMLPAATARVPHPPVQGMKGPMRGAAEANNALVVRWIKDALLPIGNAGVYASIDLTTAPKAAKPPAAAAANGVKPPAGG